MPEQSSHLVVGLTGGIAGGKSTVSMMLRDLGAQLVDFDVLARKVVQPGTPGLAKVVDSFGKQILTPDGSLDRRRLAEIVFRDRKKRRTLEQLIHPDIYEAFVRQVSRITAGQFDAVIVAEVPLLVEVNLIDLFDRIVLVYTSRQVQIERLMDRPDMTRRAAEDMLEAQLPIEEKKKYADHIVYNDGSLESTRRQVRALWEELVAFQRQPRDGQRAFREDNG